MSIKVSGNNEFINQFCHGNNEDTFLFILKNWNITLPKMVKNNILEE